MPARLAENARLLERERADEPTRDYALSRCVRAWDDLSTCRPVGMAVGAIPITAIWTWCDRHGLDQEAAEIVEHVIRTLDVERAMAEAADRAVKEAQGPRAKGRTA